MRRGSFSEHGIYFNLTLRPRPPFLKLLSSVFLETRIHQCSLDDFDLRRHRFQHMQDKNLRVVLFAEGDGIVKCLA
jgi:hypothetical protein